MSDQNLISKTRRKRQMHELQAIGVALSRLPAHELARLELPAALREAVDACRTMTKHEAIRRQLQYIGRIMRELDAGPIAAQLEAMHAPTHRQTALFHRAERWREEFLADPDSVDRFALEHPGCDPRRLRELAASAREERSAERPPKRYRELFQVINAILQDPAKPRP